MMDIDQIQSDVRNDDLHKARDDISDGELLEDDHSRSPDESFGPESRNEEHVKTWDKENDKLKEKEIESERPKDYGRERDRGDNSLKEKEKLRDHDRHKDRDREKDKNNSRDRDKDRRRELDRVETRDRDEDKEKHRVKGREKAKERENGRDKEKEGSSSKHRDKEKDRERGKEKSKSKERDREDDRGIGRRKDSKDQEVGYRDAGKQERTKEQNKDIELDRDLEIPRERKERDRENDREREKEKDRDREGREKDKDKHRDKDRDREREKDREKEKDRDKEGREKERDRPRDKDREREREKEREKEKDRDKEERDKDRDKLRDKGRDREREKDRDKEEREKDRDKSRDKDRDREKDRERERTRDRDRDKGRDKVKERTRDRDRERESDRDKEREKEDRSKAKDKESKDGSKSKQIETRGNDDANEKEKNKDRDNEEKIRRDPDSRNLSTIELQEKIEKLREERIKHKSGGGSDILSWVNKSRKIEEHRNAEKEKAERLARIFEEQDNVEDSDSDDDEKMKHSGKDLAGLKVLHGLDKVMEGGAVVLTLKDQNILSGGDINEDIDMLENIEIGEQNARNEAYNAAKKKPGIYEDKFQNDINAVKTVLPQYDDPFKEEGVTLDETGGINDEYQKKLDEIRKKLHIAAMGNQADESLAQSGTGTSDYYTHDEMLQFKKPKKKKKLRKKDKIDVDALEAEAIASGLGAEDLGSRADTQRKILREEAEKAEAQKRKDAYETALNKATEASRGLRDAKPSDEMQVDDDGDTVFGGEDEDLYKSLEKARQAALKKQDKVIGSGPQAVARIAVSANQLKGDGQSLSSNEASDNKVVFTEMEEFVWGLQLDEESHKPAVEDVFNEEDDISEPKKEDSPREQKGVWMPESMNKAELMNKEESDHHKEDREEEVIRDDMIKEASVGKGLAGALQLLKERGAFSETVDWGGRNMDKKKSKLVGVRDNDGPKEILLDRLDEFGRVMTPKEAFRKLSHKFHGKGPGKMKQEKRMKQYQEELKLKKMNTGDTPLMSMEKMRDVQSKLRTPYVVLSGQIKPGQTSDPRSGFATVEKEHPGSLTPMLGDRKVEHFLGIKRKPEVGAMGPPKKPKTS